MNLQNIIKEIFDTKYTNIIFKLYNIYNIILSYKNNNILSEKFDNKLQLVLNFFLQYHNNLILSHSTPFYVYFYIYYKDNEPDKEYSFLNIFNFFLETQTKNVSIHKKSKRYILLKFDILNTSNIQKLITEIDTNSFITKVNLKIPLKKHKNIVSDSISINNEPRRLIYGWNDKTGDQLHKYLPPNFDEHTKSINDYIRIKQKEYYVAIIDDGCITNYTDYQSIINNNCNSKITRYYDDFSNNINNKNFNNDLDIRQIILKNYDLKDVHFCNNYSNIKNEYGEHGTRVISALCGYKFGISPNANFISYCSLDDGGNLGGNIDDIIEDIENNTNIIAVNKSLGPSFNSNVTSFLQDINHTITNSNLYSEDILDKIYTIAAGNENDDVLQYDNLKKIYDVNLNNTTNLSGYSTRFDSKKSNYKSLYTLIQSEDDQILSNILSVGSFDIFNKEIEDYSNSGHPYFYYQKPDMVAPSDSYGTSRDGSFKRSTGTSFSSPMICGLSVLVRCLIDYLVEKHNYPAEYQNYENILNIMRESCIMFSNNFNMIYYTKFDQGHGFPTLFNIYKYLKSQSKSNFTSPFYNNSLIKTTYEFIQQDNECEKDNNLDSNECLEYAFNRRINKINEVDDEYSVFKDTNLLKKSYNFVDKYENNSKCLLDENNNKVYYKNKQMDDEKYICKQTKVNNNPNNLPLCYKRKVVEKPNGDKVFKDILVDEHNNYMLEDCGIEDNNTFYSENMSCNGGIDDSFAVNKYGICRKKDNNFNKKGKEIIIRDNKNKIYFYIGLGIYISCMIICMYIIIKH